MCIRDCLSILLTLLALSASDGQTGRTTPALQYDKPSGFAAPPVTHRPALADSLDGVIHVYPFRPWPVPDWIWNRIAFLSHQRP